MFTLESLSSSTIGFGVLAFLAIAHRWLVNRNEHVPPGPPRYPVIGNALNFPMEGWAKIFPEWHRKYGNFLYANLMGKPVFIIGDREGAEELLNARGKITDSRPHNVLAVELMGWDEWNLALIPPGKILSTGRSLVRKSTSRVAVNSYRPLIEENNRLLLKNALEMDGNPLLFINRAIGKLIIRLLYADALSGEEADKLIKTNEEAVRLTSESVSRVYLVNIFPILKYIPAWVPGAGFQRLAARVKDLSNRVRNDPWNNVLEDIKSGIRRPSVADKLIEQHGANMATRDSAAMIYMGGHSTTSSAIGIAIYALLMYPEIQAKAFQEIDRVIGQDRLPTPEDFDNLPYMAAIWKETLRWSSPFPTMLPHLTTEDTVYNGYLIPKGSTLMASVKYMLRDERFWDNPAEFRPERFLQKLKEGQVDPKSLVYGFGRRICPGREMADYLAPSTIMVLLWAFEFVPIEGEARPDPKDAKFVDAVISYPADFRCQFRPRSENVVRLIREATADE